MTTEVTSNQKEGTVLQCGFPALSMLRACNSDVISVANCNVIMPLRPSSPFSAARSSASVIALTLATLIRIGIMCDMSGTSISKRSRMMSSNAEVRGASRLAGEASSTEGATSTDVLGAGRPGKD